MSDRWNPNSGVFSNAPYTQLVRLAARKSGLELLVEKHVSLAVQFLSTPRSFEGKNKPMFSTTKLI